MHYNRFSPKDRARLLLMAAVLALVAFLVKLFLIG